MHISRLIKNFLRITELILGKERDLFGLRSCSQPQTEVMGRNLVDDFITSEYKVAVKAVLDAALQGKETANFEFPLFTKNQDRVGVLLNATTRRDKQGNIVGVVGVGQDITERKRPSGVLGQSVHHVGRRIITTNPPIFRIPPYRKVNPLNHYAAAKTNATPPNESSRNPSRRPYPH